MCVLASPSRPSDRRSPAAYPNTWRSSYIAAVVVSVYVRRRGKGNDGSLLVHVSIHPVLSQTDGRTGQTAYTYTDYNNHYSDFFSRPHQKDKI